jgi:hypothetical protein
MTIAGQRLGKHIPRVTSSTIEGYRLLGNGAIHTHSRTTEIKCFPWGPCRGIIRESDFEAVAVGVQKSTRSISSTTENENENGVCPSDL